MGTQSTGDIPWHELVDFSGGEEPHNGSGMNVGDSRSTEQDRDSLEFVMKTVDSESMELLVKSGFAQELLDAQADDETNA